MDTILLIPAYKPDVSLLDLTASLLSLNKYDILIINDGSGSDYDNIFAELKRKATVLNHAVNKGKGAALKTGIGYVKQNLPSCKYIITADADGQHTIEDICKISNELNKSGGFVIGTRKFTGKVPLRSRFGNFITRFVFWLACGVKVSDTQTGLRGFDSSFFFDMLEISGERYEYETNVLLMMAKKKVEINEVEIKTIYENDNSSSHFNPLLDSLRIYLKIFKYSISALTSFLLDNILFNLFAYLFTLNLTISIVVARVISAIYNFTLNRKIVFKSSRSVFRDIAEYAILALVILLLNIGIMKLFVNYIGIEKWLAKLITDTTLFILSYIVQDKIIFKIKNKKK